MIVTPAPTVPGVIAQCAEAGIPAAIVISAGFKELGAPGIALEQKVLAEARRARMRIVGPNCLGLMNPLGGLNATFAGEIARPGNVAFLSQSGALLTAILDWSLREQVGFSGFVSIGSMLDVGWGDLIDYFGNDPRTRAIVICMETIGDARAFLSAAREVALSKPIIVLKAGRTSQAAKAAASHTGSLAGSDEVLDAAFRRLGVLRVSRIGELFHMAEVLSKQPRPQGPRLTIVTNAGVPGVLATDTLIGNGGELATVSAETMTRLDEVLPAGDLAALEQLMVRFSQLVIDQPWIKEIDINPLLAGPDEIVALDARVVLHDPKVKADELPRLAIRPYPRQYSGPWTAPDGTELTIRPIRHEDEPLMVAFHADLSEQSVRQRYFQALKFDQRTAHDRLVRVCFCDYDREISLIALQKRPGDGARTEIVAVGRLSKSRAVANEGEYAILVKDSWQRRGLGTELLRRIVEIAQAERLERVEADILTENLAMQKVSERLGFAIGPVADEPLVKAVLALKPPPREAAGITDATAAAVDGPQRHSRSTSLA